MINVAEQKQRILAIGLYKRFMPAHRAIRSMIARQTFGPLREVWIEEGAKFTWPAASGSFFRREETPGGVLFDVGVHVLDLLLWWLGRPQEFDYVDDARDGLEANCLINATFSHPGIDQASKVQGRARLSRDWSTANCYCFRFDGATLHCRVNRSNCLEITFHGLPMTFASESREPNVGRPAPQTLALETNSQAFIAQLQDVCAAVREKRPPMVTGEEGSRSIRWIEECHLFGKSPPEPWQKVPVAR